MKIERKIFIYTGLALVALMVFLSSPANPLGSSSYASCSTVTETSVEIGASNSTTILSKRSGRSYARIQLNRDADGTATSTPSIAFGTIATLGNGMQLSTSTPFLEFGMDTDHAYSGIVTAINSGSASTTLRVTECR